MQSTRSVKWLVRSIGSPQLTPRSPHGIAGVRFYARNSAPETFDASELVLKLDAADSPYVRTVEDIDIQKKVGVLPPGLYRLPRKPSKRYIPSSPVGLLRLALLDQPLNLRVAKEHLRGRQWDKYNITESIQLPLLDLKIATTKHRSLLDAGGLEASDNYNHILSQLQGHKNSKLSSKLNKRLKTYEGCRQVLTNSLSVVKAIEKLHHKGDPRICPEGCLPTSSALRIINSVSAALLSHDLKIGKYLCEAGIYFAARSLNPTALMQYIDTMIACQYDVGLRTNKALYYLVSSWLAEKSSGRETTKTVTREDILKILTGWSSAGVPSLDEVREPCFASLALLNEPTYRKYIRALGVLGASEALSYEWTNAVSGNMLSRIDRKLLFIDAFMLTKDPRKALGVVTQTASGFHNLVEMHGSSREGPGLEELKDDTILTGIINYFILHGIPNYDAAKTWDSMMSLLDKSQSLVVDMMTVKALSNDAAGEPCAAMAGLEKSLNVVWMETGDGPGYHVEDGSGD